MDQVASKSHARREILIFTAHMLLQPRLGPQLRPLDWQDTRFTNIHRALITSRYLVFSNCVSSPPTECEAAETHSQYVAEHDWCPGDVAPESTSLVPRHSNCLSQWLSRAL